MKEGATGRNPKLSKELIDEICTYIENGNSNSDTCKIVGIGESTFYMWLSDAEKVLKGEENIPYAELKVELLDNIKRSEASFKAFHINNITKASRKEWTASAWLLERKAPKEWGRVDRSSIMLTSDNGLMEEMSEMLQEMMDEDKVGE